MITATSPEPTPEQYGLEYAASRHRIAELLAEVSAADAALVVPACPDWTVQQLTCHLTGICTDLVARRNPTGDVQDWVDAQVAERAGRPVAQVLEEWHASAPAFEALIARKPAAFGGLVYDLVAHEHDLRAALGRPGARHSTGVHAGMFIEATILERDLAAHDLPALRLTGLTGTTAPTGPTSPTGSLAEGAPTTTWIIGAGTVVASEPGAHEPPQLADIGSAGEPGLSIETDLYELFRLLGSRRSRAQFLAAHWVGDVERYLPALAHMSLPERDLNE